MICDTAVRSTGHANDVAGVARRFIGRSPKPVKRLLGSCEIDQERAAFVPTTPDTAGNSMLELLPTLSEHEQGGDSD